MSLMQVPAPVHHQQQLTRRTERCELSDFRVRFSLSRNYRWSCTSPQQGPQCRPYVCGIRTWRRCCASPTDPRHSFPSVHYRGPFERTRTKSVGARSSRQEDWWPKMSVHHRGAEWKETVPCHSIRCAERPEPGRGGIRKRLSDGHKGGSCARPRHKAAHSF